MLIENLNVFTWISIFQWKKNNKNRCCHGELGLGLQRALSHSCPYSSTLDMFPSTSFDHANQQELSWLLPSHDSGDIACQEPLPKGPCHGLEGIELIHANKQCPAAWLQGYWMYPGGSVQKDRHSLPAWGREERYYHTQWDVEITQ